MTDGIEMIIVVTWKNALIVGPMPGEEHVVRPDEERHERR